jgi:hypothetical protein
MGGVPSRRRRPTTTPAGRVARATALLLALAMVVRPTAAAAGDAVAPGLHGLARVRVSVDVARAVDGLAADALHARLVAALRRAAPPLAVDADAADRRHLRVALEPRSATQLRGFWLPFSGTYAIGLVTLAVERPVVVSDRPTPAAVWRDERVVAVPWRAAAAEAHRATDAMLDALLAARPGP